jgi:hypothetical protein
MVVACGGLAVKVRPTDFDRHVVAVVPRVVSGIEKVAEYASLIATGLSRTRT